MNTLFIRGKFNTSRLRGLFSSENWPNCGTKELLKSMQNNLTVDLQLELRGRWGGTLDTGGKHTKLLISALQLNSMFLFFNRIVDPTECWHLLKTTKTLCRHNTENAKSYVSRMEPKTPAGISLSSVSSPGGIWQLSHWQGLYSAEWSEKGRGYFPSLSCEPLVVFFLIP